MPHYCVASGCYNSSKKGAVMHIFPRDLQRKEKWIENAGGPSGFKYCRIPNENSFLCEFHFMVDMYEKERVDCRKKLKSSAVPTIFRELVIQQNKKNVAAFIPDTTSCSYRNRRSF
ncbi:peroxynitrite isomerase THAP4-like [Temnothorax americanus]|uniref:peroxynitrite isomerase THAP4-like n=1 Tax=Temnothorax americanus TaxID=1964332 RepID=UPI0040694F7E